MTRLRSLLQSMDAANRRYRLVDKNEGIVVALSGGPDSVALLTLLLKWRKKFSLRLAAAHVDHGLQADSKRFAAFCGRLCRELDIPLYSKRVEIGSLARRERRSLEEAGRLARYAFFRDVAKKTGCRKIATAHTEDDQVETILMRILRGSGLRGLAGVSPKRKEGSFEVIRPLIFCRKAELLAFLKENKVSYCTDKTNAARLYARNRVRHDLLPALETFNPGARQALLSLQAVAGESQDFLDRAAERAIKRCRAGRPGRPSLKVAALRRLHPAVMREIFLRAIAESKGDLKKITQEHVESLVCLAAAQAGPLEAHLPDGLTVRRKASELVFDTRR